MTKPVALVPPPREVPQEAVFAVLAHRDVYWTAVLFIPAAAVIYAVSQVHSDFQRAGLVLTAGVLLLLGILLVRPSLLRGMKTLHRMRHGFLAPGRVVACRLAWDGKKREMPYADFLSNWVVHVGKSQMRKASGCLPILVGLFLLPMILFALGIAIALALAYFGDTPPDSDTTRAVLLWFGGSVLMIAAMMAWARFFARNAEKVVELHMKAEVFRRETQDDSYEDIARRLLDMARGNAQPIVISEPLPVDNHGVELICRVQYGVRGELRTGEGRLPLYDRLDPEGIEPLLFDPERPSQVVFLAGLPGGVSIDAGFKWKGPAPHPAAIAFLAVTGLAAMVALLGFFWYLA